MTPDSTYIGSNRRFQAHGGMASSPLALFVYVVIGALWSLSSLTFAQDSLLQLIRQQDGVNQLQVTGQLQTSYDVEYSPDLRNWSHLLSFVLPNSPSVYFDSDPDTARQRYYRLRWNESVEDLNYYLIGTAGYGPLGGAVEYYDQTTGYTSAHLVAVDATSPGQPIILEEAGHYAIAETNYAHLGILMEANIDAATGLYHNLRTRYTTYSRDNRLMKVDQIAGAGGPVPQLWSSLRTTDICHTHVINRWVAHNYANASQAWTFFSAPGPSGSCNSPYNDEILYALRTDMGPDDDPLIVPRPLVPIYTEQGAIEGFIVQDLHQIQRVDSDFENAIDLWTHPLSPVPQGDNFIHHYYSGGTIFGATTPGIWVFLSPNEDEVETLFAYHLAGDDEPVALMQLPLNDGGPNAEDFFSERSDTDGASLYFAATNGISASAIYRLDSLDLSLHLLEELQFPVQELGLTDSQVIVKTDNSLRSIPKAGGVAQLIATVDLPETYIRHEKVRPEHRPIASSTVRTRSFLTSGETIWYETIRNNLFRKVFIVDSDGSDAEILDYHSIVSWSAPRAALLSRHANPSVIHLAQQAGNVVNGEGYSNMPLRVFDAVTGNEVLDLGNFPAPFESGTTTPVVVRKFPVLSDPLQEGASGLIPIRGRDITDGETAGGDLLYYQSDRKDSLAPGTHFGID